MNESINLKKLGLFHDKFEFILRHLMHNTVRYANIPIKFYLEREVGFGVKLEFFSGFRSDDEIILLNDCLHLHASMNLKSRSLRFQVSRKRTRPDTRLPQSRAGGQGPYLRSLDDLGRSSEAVDRKNPKKVKCDGRTDRQSRV